MNFLEDLFDIPPEWGKIWSYDDNGVLTYRKPGAEASGAVAVADKLDTEAEKATARKEKAAERRAEKRAKAHEEEEEKHGHGHKKEIGEMSPVEMGAIAGSCNAKELMVVCKKGADPALMKALSNAQMDTDKVIYILTKRSPAAAVLQLIARSRFAKDRTVAAAIVKNPKTPLHISRSLIGRLTKSALKEVIKAGGLSNALKVAARNKLKKKK